MMRFTEDEARQASEAGEPIMLDRDWVRSILADHHIEFEEFVDSLALPVDAAVLLDWIGY
jgi:hypothetical protein